MFAHMLAIFFHLISVFESHNDLPNWIDINELRDLVNKISNFNFFSFFKI
jgi:hypothetical protein